MPRKAKGARLYQRPSNGVFYIKDTGCSPRSTGTTSRVEAERALAQYITGRDTVTGTRSPEKLTVPEALTIYAEQHAIGVADPERISYAIQALLPFWAVLTIADVKGATCRQYCQTRVRTFKDGSTAPIGQGTLRRELNVLQAAINYCHVEGYLTHPAKVALPEKVPARDRWLTRDEVARLIRASRRTGLGRHLARFILIAIYTGTRKDAILRLRFLPQTKGGWIDTAQGVMYRRGAEERETNKRRKPVKLPRKLLAHCRRWQGGGATWVVERNGVGVADVKTAFAGACRAAGLAGVTPHSLKHTAITWAMQAGMKVETAADYFDTSAETIRRVYYHHSPEYQEDAAALMDRAGKRNSCSV